MPASPPASVTWAVIVVVVLVAYLGSLARAVPSGARRVALATLRRPSVTAFRAGLAVALLVLSLVACLAPGGVTVASTAFSAVVVGNLALLVTTAATRRK